MTSIRHSPVGGRTVRFTKISTFGQVVTGACSKVVSSGWTQVQVTDNVTAVNRYDIRTGGPVACLPVRTKPVLNYCDVVVDFVQVDPDLLNMVTGATLITDVSGVSAGFAGDTDTYATGSAALEVWTGLAGQSTCPNGAPRYGYLLLPWLSGAVHGPVVHNIGTVSFRMTAVTVAQSQWGSGPYNVVADSGGNAVPLLTPIPATRHRHWQVTTVPPPATVAGCQAV